MSSNTLYYFGTLFWKIWRIIHSFFILFDIHSLIFIIPHSTIPLFFFIVIHSLCLWWYCCHYIHSFVGILDAIRLHSLHWWWKNSDVDTCIRRHSAIFVPGKGGYIQFLFWHLHSLLFITFIHSVFLFVLPFIVVCSPLILIFVLCHSFIHWYVRYVHCSVILISSIRHSFYLMECSLMFCVPHSFVLLFDTILHYSIRAFSDTCSFGVCFRAFGLTRFCCSSAGFWRCILLLQYCHCCCCYTFYACCYSWCWTLFCSFRKNIHSRLLMIEKFSSCVLLPFRAYLHFLFRLPFSHSFPCYYYCSFVIHCIWKILLRRYSTGKFTVPTFSLPFGKFRRSGNSISQAVQAFPHSHCCSFFHWFLEILVGTIPRKISWSHSHFPSKFRAFHSSFGKFIFIHWKNAFHSFSDKAHSHSESGAFLRVVRWLPRVAGAGPSGMVRWTFLNVSGGLVRTVSSPDGRFVGWFRDSRCSVGHFIPGCCFGPLVVDLDIVVFPGLSKGGTRRTSVRFGRFTRASGSAATVCIHHYITRGRFALRARRSCGRDGDAWLNSPFVPFIIVVVTLHWLPLTDIHHWRYIVCYSQKVPDIDESLFRLILTDRMPLLLLFYDISFIIQCWLHSIPILKNLFHSSSSIPCHFDVDVVHSVHCCSPLKNANYKFVVQKFPFLTMIFLHSILHSYLFFIHSIIIFSDYSLEKLCCYSFWLLFIILHFSELLFDDGYYSSVVVYYWNDVSMWRHLWHPNHSMIVFIVCVASAMTHRPTGIDCSDNQ